MNAVAILTIAIGYKRRVSEMHRPNARRGTCVPPVAVEDCSTVHKGSRLYARSPSEAGPGNDAKY
jgi:hypothetical protein